MWFITIQRPEYLWRVAAVGSAHQNQAVLVTQLVYKWWYYEAVMKLWGCYDVMRLSAPTCPRSQDTWQYRGVSSSDVWLGRGWGLRIKTLSSSVTPPMRGCVAPDLLTSWPPISRGGVQRDAVIPGVAAARWTLGGHYHYHKRISNKPWPSLQ